MTGAERGFLLLSSHLGNPERKPLTTAQLRTLADRMRSAPRFSEDRELVAADLTALGYRSDMAYRILALLDEEDLLDHYLTRAARQGCVPITRVSRDYPVILRQRLGLDSPGCLWAKGDVSILKTPAIALVGSRDLNPENKTFAEAVGYEAAMQGLTLVSGNARGADKTAQEACLKAGGRVISIVADPLASHKERQNVLFLSEEDFEAEFSAQRALSRNRCIHALGRMVFVAQARAQQGGTWDGTVKNLRFGWSEVACFRDGSEASILLEQIGAYLIGMEDLKDFGTLQESEWNILT